MKSLVSAFLEMFQQESSDIADLTRPYKVLMALMDKAEIGESLMKQVFLPLVQSLRLHHEMQAPGEVFLKLSIHPSSQYRLIPIASSNRQHGLEHGRSSCIVAQTLSASEKRSL